MSDAKVCPTCGSEYPVSERFCPRDGSALKSQSGTADLVGSVIAERYHVIKKLGEGGMGAVYLAEHVKMGRKSAIKVMNPGMNQDPDAIARFNREAANASRMNHPNICAIYDFGETDDGIIYLAMEFIEGDSLTKLIEETGALPPARAASILHQAADALQVAHDYGIVHRDLKPDNIMIARGRDNSDMVKVVDFGIAKSHESNAQKVTKTGLVVGTPEYMSPEQLAGDKLDGRSDIYSLALVGFNMLTGTLPFPSETAQEAMIMRLTDKPKSLAEMRPELAWPEQLQVVMDKALARTVSDRYQKAGDFGREFSMAIEGMPIRASDAATRVMGSQPAMAVPQTRVATPKDKQTPRSAPTVAQPATGPLAAKSSNRGMMIGVGLSVVAVIAVGGLAMSGAFGSSDTPPSNGAVITPPDTTTKATATNSGNQLPPAGRQGDPGRQGDGRAAGGGNPPAGGGGNPNTGGGATNPNTGGVTLPSVASIIERIDKLAVDANMTEKQAEAAVQEINETVGRATGEEKGRLYIAQISFFEKLKLQSAACRAAQKAIDSGLTGSDLSLARNYVAQDECKSL